MTLNINTYVKRPIPIAAVLLTRDNKHEVAEWCKGSLTDDGQVLVIPTLEGPMCCEVGSYVVRGPVGEFYPVRGDVFAMTYERVHEE